MKHNPTIRDIDLAWERINAMGGVPCCAHDHVYNLAIGDCLRIIESLGGYDPAARRHARKAVPFTPPGMRARDMMPCATLAALNGDDTNIPADVDDDTLRRMHAVLNGDDTPPEGEAA